MSEQTLTIDFDDPTNFTFDSDLIEFTTLQKPRLKYLPDEDIQLYANFSAGEDANYSYYDVTGTLGGTASVSGGELDLTGGNAYLEYDSGNLDNMLQQGCVRLRWKPNYTGNAPAVQELFQSCSSTTNRVHIRHNSNLFQCYVYNSSGVLLFNMAFAWTPSTIKYYEIELNFDATGGNARVFIDGVLEDSDTGTGTRTYNNLCRFGASGGMNSYIDAVLIFDEVQHTSGYTPNWSDIPDTLYSLTNPSLVYDIITTMNALSSIGAYDITFTATGNDTVKGTIVVDDQDKYFTTSWEDSDATYSQSNTETEINTNAGSLSLDYDEVSFRWFLHSEDGSTRPELTQCVINYQVMDFVVEDGTGKSDATSYATVDQYKQYWLNRGTVITDTNETIQAYLNNSTEYLDISYTYKGERTNDDQALDWPRYYVEKEKKGVYYENDEIPCEIVEATCYLAAKVSEGELNATTNNLRSYTIGPVSKTFSGSSNVTEYTIIDKLLKHLIVHGNDIVRVN